MNKKLDLMRGMRLAALGLFLMAIFYALASAMRISGMDTKWEFIGAFGIFISWIPVVLGGLILRTTRSVFSTAMGLSVAGFLFVGLQLGIAYWRYSSGIVSQTFLQMEVMLFGYLSLLTMMAVYRSLMKGTASVSGETAATKGANDWKGVWYVALVLIFAGTLFLPLATLLSGTTRMMVSGAVIALVFVVETYLCFRLLSMASRGEKEAKKNRTPAASKGGAETKGSAGKEKQK